MLFFDRTTGLIPTLDIPCVAPRDRISFRYSAVHKRHIGISRAVELKKFPGEAECRSAIDPVGGDLLK